MVGLTWASDTLALGYWYTLASACLPRACPNLWKQAVEEGGTQLLHSGSPGLFWPCRDQIWRRMVHLPQLGSPRTVRLSHRGGGAQQPWPDSPGPASSSGGQTWKRAKHFPQSDFPGPILSWKGQPSTMGHTFPGLAGSGQATCGRGGVDSLDHQDLSGPAEASCGSQPALWDLFIPSLAWQTL